jgi:hypothetical protein
MDGCKFTNSFKLDEKGNLDVVQVIVPPTLTRREPMPQTIEYYKAQQEREGKLILEMKAEISDLKVRADRLEKKLLKRG